MNFSTNDNPFLVAPRPVRVTPVHPLVPRSAHLRLSSVAHDTDHLVIQEDNENIETPPRIPSTDKEPCSSRASPLYVSPFDPRSYRAFLHHRPVHGSPMRSDRLLLLFHFSNRFH